MDATPWVLKLERVVGGEVTQGSANPELSYGRPLAFGEGEDSGLAATIRRRFLAQNQRTGFRLPDLTSGISHLLDDAHFLRVRERHEPLAAGALTLQSFLKQRAHEGLR